MSKRADRGAAPWPMMLLILLLLPAGAEGQLPIEGWIRPLVAVPLGDFGGRGDGIEAGTSVGFDAGASITLGALEIYGEYQVVSFRCGECAEAGVEETALDRGWGAGVIVPVRSPLAGLQPWGRIGVIGHHLRFRAAEEAMYSDPALGWAVGLGAVGRPSSWLRVEPMLLIRGYDGHFGFIIDVPDRQVSVRYLSLGLGIGIGL